MRVPPAVGRQRRNKLVDFSVVPIACDAVLNAVANPRYARIGVPFWLGTPARIVTVQRGARLA
jgi:hypothetical protein